MATLEQFAEASAICELRWPYMKELNSRTRFLGFQKAGVQLVVASENGKMEGVCFVLPAECRIHLALAKNPNTFRRGFKIRYI